jgi:hypothetical protein
VKSRFPLDVPGGESSATIPARLVRCAGYPREPSYHSLGKPTARCSAAHRPTRFCGFKDFSVLKFEPSEGIPVCLSGLLLLGRYYLSAFHWLYRNSASSAAVIWRRFFRPCDTPIPLSSMPIFAVVSTRIHGPLDGFTNAV